MSAGTEAPPNTIQAVNPTQIVPIGPEIDFWQPHGREG